MRFKSTITILLLSSCVAMAQAPAKAKAKAATAAPAQQSAKPAETKPAAPATGQQTVGVPAPSKPILRGARRDPFVSPIVKMGGDSNSAACTGGGKRCLVVSQLQIKGVAKTADGMIAMVTSQGTNRTYFLREQDPVYNGYVLKITEDSVVFKETMLDNLGRPQPRDIEKRVTPPSAS